MKFRRFSIGYRTLKTAIGAPVAIYLALLLDLDYYVSAGILTILCIQPTKRKSVRAAFSRFVASLIAILFAFAFFEGFTYEPAVLGFVLILFIPVLVSFRLTDGFVSSTVILLHILDYGMLTWGFFFNELLLMTVGFGTALLVNVYMPSIDRRLDEYRVRLEQCISAIFKEVASYLRKGESDWTGRELTEAAQLLPKAKALAYQDVENHLARKENRYYQYFDMRERQFEIIERVLPQITALPVTVNQSGLIAEFLEDLADHVHSGNTAGHYLGKLDRVKQEFADMPLPDNHEKFRSMAALYQFIGEMEEYLEIKQSYKGFRHK
ncbi:aromatic acid exporter family protein [Indiicoccus explosivorum]|uniref:aromatic acid exporter family protein n=1 Tax=Indiicoccus explosivorum TaxID=1917864 RepID=UPI000B43651A|nr:aromatic acid exporter family protein [Indiicoccus explosivorum]